jgi:hypothetical protein
VFNSFFGHLTEFGFALGAGLGVGAGPFILGSMILERHLDQRKRDKIRSNRRPPSITADTAIIEKIVE